MSPTLPENNHAGCLWVDPKVSGNARAALAICMTFSNLAHILFRQLTVAVARALLHGRLPQSKLIGMKRVFALGTPFQIRDVVVFWVPVFVVYKRQAVEVFQKRIGNKSVNKSWVFFALLRKVNAQVIGFFAWFGGPKFLHGLMSDTAIGANPHRFGVRKDLPRLIDRIQALKIFNVFHKIPLVAWNTR
jgi:hypothetical protein